MFVPVVFSLVHKRQSKALEPSLGAPHVA